MAKQCFKGKFLAALLFMATAATATLVIPSTNDSCLPTCKRTGTVISCTGCIPSTVPDTIKEIDLTNIDPDEFQQGRFCQLSWKNVTAVKFLPVHSIKPKPFDLKGRVFDCLDNIEAFKFSRILLIHFSPDAFSGLRNVAVLDLSDCKAAAWLDLYKTLAIKRNLPKLSHLILSRFSRYTRVYMNLNQAFVNFLYMRPITSLDLSFDLVRLNFSNSQKMCETLTYLSYAGADVDMVEETFLKCNTCQSLQTLDLTSGIFWREIFYKYSCVNYSAGMSLVPFLSGVKVLYINNIVTSVVKLFNCSLDLFIDTLITELHFAYNNIPTFEFILKNGHLEFLDLSHNNIHTINGNTFTNLSSLTKLDLSNNKLSQGVHFQTFSILFKEMLLLEMIDLSFNKLLTIPDNTFESCLNLKQLFLSQNSFQQLTFNVTHLLNLTTLDLRFNSITYLDINSRKLLDTLYIKQTQRNRFSYNFSKVQVLLEGNPFSCRCAALDFLKWFTSSSIVSATRDKCYCELDGGTIEMNEAAITAADADCKKAERRRLLKVLLPTLLSASVIVVLLTLIVLYKRRKKKTLQQRFGNGIRRLQENVNIFPVFLSYSSEDSDFVQLHMLQQLQQSLESLSGLDRELVCNADAHFHPARTIMFEIFRCLKVSEVFVAVISENYCRSRFCRYEIEHAHLLQKPIILIFKEHVEEENMNLVTREVFETFTRVQLVVEGDQYRINPDWPQICESIIQLMA